MNQKHLKPAALIVFISVMSMTPQLATDLYMPALPSMTKDLGTTQELTTFTMTAFLIAMAVGMLLLTPVSDKYGRRPVLLFSAIVNTLSCVACAVAPNIEIILVLRGIQGIAAGGVFAIAAALAKDCFEGKRMSFVLSLTMAISMVAPTVAPIIGVAVFNVGGWRGEFVVLSVFMALSVVGALLLQEPLPKEKRLEGGVLDAFRGIGVHLRRRSFVGPMLFCAFAGAGFMAYLGIASYVYIEHFGMSEGMFTLCFAIASLAAVAGPLLSMKFPVVDPRKSFCVTAIVILLSGIALVLVKGAPFGAFLVCMLPYLFCASFLRPMTMNYLLRNTTSNVGAASSIINFCNNLFGCMGMVLVAIVPGSYIFALGCVIVATIVVATICWLLFYPVN